MSVKLINDGDQVTCPLVLRPELTNGQTNRHLRLICADCELNMVRRMNLGQVEDLYNQGYVTQATWEAYAYVWAHGAPRFSNLGSQHGVPLVMQDAQRRARKLWAMMGRTTEEYPG